jgi:hypothetical protein
MTPVSGAAAAAAPAGRHRASPFAGTDLCAKAGWRVRAGGRRPVFDDDVWCFDDVEGVAVQLCKSDLRMDFTTVADPDWRLLAKEYLLARMIPGHERVAVLPGAYRFPLALRSCKRRLAELARWLNWLTADGVGSLQQVSQQHCDRYLQHRRVRRGKDGAMPGGVDESVVRLAAAVVIELALYGELFTTGGYATGFRPWAGRSPAQVASMRTPDGNKTEVVRQEILQPMLAAALYLADTIGPRVAALAGQVRRQRPAASGRWASAGDIAAVLGRHRQAGQPLEAAPPHLVQARTARGQDRGDPLLGVSLAALARQAAAGRIRPGDLPALRPLITETLHQVGAEKPWGRHAETVPRAGGGGAVPWTLPLHERDVRDLTSLAATACLLVVATLTGMRESELMELRTGCRRPPAAGPFTRHRLAGKLIKGQPLGGTDEEWVVIEQVHQAVALAERLSGHSEPGHPVFGRFSFSLRYRWFREWVNGPAGRRLGLSPIPGGSVTLRALRRTLARELAYRPGGLLAAKIHLKHISVATTEGYASRPGGAQAKLLAEIAEHEAGRNLQLVLTEFRNYQAGILPAGPGARELTEFFASVDGGLTDHAAAPNVLASDQHVLNLLAKRAGVLHLGVASYCWFTDPSRALCLKLAGTPGADKPLAGMCDSARCPQATHHPCHRAVWAKTAEDHATFLGQIGRAHAAERSRLQTELQRARRVLDAIDAATGEPRHDEQAQ